MSERFSHISGGTKIIHCNAISYVLLLISTPITPDKPCVVGPCHHGMARPQVADRGTASNMEGSCE